MVHALRAFSDLQADRKGSIAIIFGLSLAMLAIGTAAAIDMSRAVSASNKLGDILDVTALTAAKLLNNPSVSDVQINSAATTLFQMHAASLTSTGTTIATPTVSIDRTTSTIVVATTLTMPTYFGGIAGLDTVTIPKSSTVTFDQTDIELALVLDNTGSMAQYTDASGNLAKLDAMKAAANQLVDTILSPVNGMANYNRVALAPFAASVNVGAYYNRVKQGWSATFDSCVIERPTWASSGDGAPSGSNAARVMSTPNTGDPNYFYSCPQSTIQPLTNTASNLHAQINAMQPSGSTAGHIGTAWGWYLLSPNWSSIWPSGSTPKPYNPHTIKAVVVVTDGAFNTSYVTAPNAEPAQQMADSYEAFKNVCDGMKAQNVVVFTVALGIQMEAEPGQTTARNALASCASSAGNYFDTASSSNLNGVFQQIASSLLSMHLTQ